MPFCTGLPDEMPKYFFFAIFYVAVSAYHMLGNTQRKPQRYSVFYMHGTRGNEVTDSLNDKMLSRISNRKALGRLSSFQEV